MENTNYRYPGVNYFTKKDAAIFCGRKEDSEKLYTQVMINKTLVLHAESGIGKSSLIQAGLLPILDERQKEAQTNGLPTYLPITIRFDFLKKNDKENLDVEAECEILINGTIDKIKETIPGLDDIKLPYIKDGSPETLWHIAKKLSKKKLKLLLIFDQFEELQNYQNKSIVYFKKELAQLIGTEIPNKIYDEITKEIAPILADEKLSEAMREEFNLHMHFLEAPSDAKLIFVVREDKLGTMSLICDYIPDIFKNDFYLHPLSTYNAQIALTKPALAEGDFDSSKFTFESDELVNKLITEIADAQTGMVDPIQIQIVATTIEKNIIDKMKADKEKGLDVSKIEYIVTADDIPPMGDIIQKFYDKCWSTVKEKNIVSDADFELKKNKFLGVLVVNERRDLANSGWLIDKQTESADRAIITELINTGLIREVPFGADKFYQLCHDRLIKPVVDSEDKRKTIELEANLKEEKKQVEEVNKRNTKIRRLNKIATAIGVFSVMMMALVIKFNRDAHKYAEDLKEKNAIISAAEAKSKNAVNELVNIYVSTSDELVANPDASTTDFKAGLHYLNKVKKITKDDKNDKAYKKIDAKIEMLEKKIKQSREP